MLIVDAHLDLAWNAVAGTRDLRLTVPELRAAELEAGLEGPGRGLGTVALPELRAGRVAVSVATVFARCTGTVIPDVDYASVAEATEAARTQLAWYRALEAEGELRVLETAAALATHVEEWRAWEASPEGGQPLLGIVLAMEGADPIATPADVDEWFEAGIRLIGLTHYGPGRYAGGTETELGLSEDAPALLAAMAAAGIALDLTHCSDPSAAEALRLFEGPVVASHCNTRALVPRQRQLTDEQIREVVARGGVIGSALDCWMLDPDWVRGQTHNEVVLARVVDHIDRVCAVTRSTAHAGIGSDLDGGFGREQTPTDVDTIADLQAIADLLAGRGYSSDEIAAIMHANWLRVLTEILP